MTRLPEPGIIAPRFLPAGLPRYARGDEFKPHLMELTGTVTDNNSTGSDPVLCVSDAEGRNWTVELASRARNAAIGLTPAAVMPGDPVRVIGHRTRRFGEQRIKAVHLTIAGRAYPLIDGALG
ncbi:hypothetical protein [Paracoccus shandongensis]|uniref:hypothetical protein n=1 Tax=Paracoccus shandongensis TaxID=2816048 RepID=UPI001A8F8C3B|nr:hypothetical protein [Paracoccus shandongensis]